MKSESMENLTLEDQCTVCGDASSGYHYKALTCEGCKGFFRRTIQKKLSYVCKNDNQCPLDKSNRNTCQKCRYNKCLEVGMAPELVLSMEKREEKRQLIEDNREKRKLMQLREQLKSLDTSASLNEEDEQLLHILTQAYCKTLDQVEKISLIDLEKDERIEDKWQQVVAPFVKKCLLFALQMPGFDTLPSEVRGALVNHAWLSITLLLVCRERESINSTYSMPAFDNLFSSFHRLNLDDTEMAVCAALLLLDATPLHHEAQRVILARDTVVETLVKYQSHQRAMSMQMLVGDLSVLSKLFYPSFTHFYHYQSIAKAFHLIIE